MIRLIKSTFYNEAETKRKLADFILQTDKLSMGEECEKFEKAFAKKQGRKFAVLVSSGSNANLILIQALLNLGLLKRDDLVFFSALTWATNVMPLIQLGLRTAAIDCQLETLNLSSKIIKEHLETEKPRAVFLTNVLGLGGDLPKIQELCAENDILLLEDNCESLGSQMNGTTFGNFGLASTFSFFVGHHMSTIEGGMVCTDDEDLYAMLVMVRAHGWDRNISTERKEKLRKRYGVDDFFAKYTFYDLAYNVRPTEITGFLGGTQLPYWDAIVEKRHTQYKFFEKLIRENNDLLPLDSSHMEVVSNFAVPLITKDIKKFKLYRDRFEKSDIEIRPIIAGDITQQPFYGKYTSGGNACPNTQTIHSNGFYFGNNPEMTEEEISLISSLLD